MGYANEPITYDKYEVKDLTKISDSLIGLYTNLYLTKSTRFSSVSSFNESADARIFLNGDTKNEFKPITGSSYISISQYSFPNQSLTIWSLNKKDILTSLLFHCIHSATYYTNGYGDHTYVFYSNITINTFLLG